MEKPKQSPKPTPENGPNRADVRNRTADSLAQLRQSVGTPKERTAESVSDTDVGHAIVQKAESCGYRLETLMQELKKIKAPQPLVALVQTDVVDPMLARSKTLKSGLQGLDIAKARTNLKDVTELYAEIQREYAMILGDAKMIAIDDKASHVKVLKQATDWACTHVAKKVLDKEFDFTRKLLSKDENVGKIELSEKYMRDLQTFDVTRSVQEFRKAGWSEPVCTQFEQTLRQMIKDAIAVETAKVELLKKKKK